MDKPLRLESKDLPKAKEGSHALVKSALSRLAEAISPTIAAKAQASAIRRCSQDFTELARKGDHPAADETVAAARFLLRGILFGVCGPDAPSPVVLSAVSHFLASHSVASAVDSEVAEFVGTRIARGDDSSVEAVCALLDIPEAARSLSPQHVSAVAAFLSVRMSPPAPSAPLVPRDPSATALKSFVALCSRFPAAVAACSVQWSPAVCRAALSVISQRRLSKEFLSASGLALAAAVVSRALRALPSGQSDASAWVASVISSELLLTATRMQSSGIAFPDAEEASAFSSTGRQGLLATLAGLANSKFVAELCPGLLVRREVLFDGLLATVVAECEAATEQFPLYFALKTLHAALEIVRGAAVAVAEAVGEAELMRMLFSRVADVVWKHQGSTVDMVQTQIRLVFGVVLEIHALLRPASSDHVDRLARRLLAQSWLARGKYAPLTRLLDFMPASRLVAICAEAGPSRDIFDGLLSAMAVRAVHSSANALFEALLHSLVREGLTAEAVAARIVSAVVSRANSAGGADGSWRTLVEDSTSALLRALPGALGPLISGIASARGCSAAARLMCILCVLNFSKRTAVAPPDVLASLVSKHVGGTIEGIVERGILHPDDPVFIEALELACATSKTAEPPTAAELAAVRLFVVSNSAHSSLNSRQRMISPITRILERIRNSLSKNVQARNAKSAKKHKQAADSAQQAPQQPQSAEDRQVLKDFLNWFADELVALMYPGGSQDRAMFALTAYRSLQAVFRESDIEGVSFPSAAHAEALLSCCWRTMDKSRQLSHEILSVCEGPLSGLSDPASVAGALRWGLRLAHSPRMHQSDAGGRVLSITFAKLLAKCHLRATLSVSSTPPPVAVTVAVSECPAPTNIASVALDFIRQLLEVLRAHVRVARSDLPLASQRCPMHGIIASIRYSLAFVPLHSLPDDAARTEWRSLLADVIQVAEDAYRTVLPVVADLAPEGYEPACTTSMIQAISQPPQEQLSTVGGEDDEEEEGGDDVTGAVGGGEVRGPEGQLMTVCSWLCVKEVSFLLAAIHELAPFPQGRPDDIVDLAQVQRAGDIFIGLLLSTRHKGAIEKAYEGFRTLCARVLRSGSPDVRNLAAAWAKQAIGILNEPVAMQVTRRSAGIPYCLSAILSADAYSSSGTCELLDRTMAELLELSSGSKGFVPQVHAFNIVSSLVNQKAVSGHIDAYLDKILVRILQAYTSKDWAVRNAATIAFNMVVKRRVAAASFSEFFVKFPALYGHLLEHLGAMCGSASGDLLQSSLFAVLTLLSRLHPSSLSDEDACSKSMSPTLFLPFVRSCALQVTFRIREAAALAVVPLVHPSAVSALCLEIATALPAASPFSGVNGVHGNLLQLEKLVDRGIGSDQAIPEELLQLLEQRLHLVADRCAPIGLAMAKVLSVCRKKVPAGDVARRFLMSSAIACRAALEASIVTWQEVSAMGPLRAEIAATLCIELATENPDAWSDATGEPLAELLDRVLCAPSGLYEVRIAGLRCLGSLVKRGAVVPAPTLDRIRARLLSMCTDDSETCFRCKKRVLQLLPKFWPDSVATGTLEKLWNRAETFLAESSLRRAAIVFLGCCTGAWPGGDPPRWKVLLGALRSCGDPSAGIGERMAAIEGMRMALGNNRSLSAEASRDVWSFLVALVQDDDVFVRQAAGETVSAVIRLPETVSPPVALEYATRVLQSLGHLVERPASALPGEPAASPLLFEVEPSNFFIEETVSDQLSRTAVEATPALRHFAEDSRWLRDRFDTAQQRAGGWPRWLTYEKEIFCPFYRTCLTAARAVMRDGWTASTEDKKLSETAMGHLHAVPFHPLIDQLINVISKKVSGAPAVTRDEEGLKMIDAMSFLLATPFPKT